MYHQKVKEEQDKIQHIQRLLLFPETPHSQGEEHLLLRQIRTHQSLKKRFSTLAQKQQSHTNNPLFV